LIFPPDKIELVSKCGVPVMPLFVFGIVPSAPRIVS